MRIGLRREDKYPLEARVPIVPEDVRRLVRDEGIEVVVETSRRRVFADGPFAEAGARVCGDLLDCPVIFGVKEIPVERLEPKKTYVFFSHVIKGQAHNMPMLKRMMELGCSLIDYERIVDDAGRRLVLFGRYAGLAGMINTLWTLGRRWAARGIQTPLARLRQARDYGCVAEAKRVIAGVGDEVRSVGLPASVEPLVCGFAGYGNVSKGAQEVYDLLPVETVAPDEVGRVRGRSGEHGRKVYKVVFREEHTVEPIDPGAVFELDDYYRHSERYRARFAQYLPDLSILVNCIYWEPRYPRLVAKADVRALFAGGARPRLEVIGDITCDVGGSIECNVRATDLDNPVYVWDPIRDEGVDGVEGDGPVVMAVDILPAELPADSSREFSRILMPFVPAIARADYSVAFDACPLPPQIRRAMIVHRGQLTEGYRYIEEYVKRSDAATS
ncbi:MAG: hypothetical protein JSV19_03565 [Phycisphaerales bacterium]|nr:MAG: hypothetical protein JSV19_03565 [Phycisphaerales bacterium]